MAYKYYNQNDYPEIPYGDGSIETSGCGLCSCCMVVENMTGHMRSRLWKRQGLPMNAARVTKPARKYPYLRRRYAKGSA